MRPSKRAIDARTRAIVVIHPNNPTGSFVARADAERIAALCETHGLVLVADEVFAAIPTIYLPERPPLPGDYFVTQAGAIDQFMIRMKHSLRDAREMLSNTVAFWMVGELASKHWDASAVDIPGLTTGFAPDVAGYPPVTLR